MPCPPLPMCSCPMGWTSIRNSSRRGGIGGIRSMRQGIRCWRGWKPKHERRGKGCRQIRIQYRSGRGRGTRQVQGVGERRGGLRERVPSSQDTHSYESSEYQTCSNECAQILHHSHLLFIRGVTRRLLMRWSGAFGCTARLHARATSVHGAWRIDSACR
jgi:hypothetical protein